MDNLAQRLVDNQNESARHRLAGDADRLAESVIRLASDLRRGAPLGEVWQMAQRAVGLLHEVSSLNGAEGVARLLPEMLGVAEAVEREEQD